MLLTLALSAGLHLGASQDIFPKLSPHAFVSQTIGTATVSIEYHRPAVRNRAIWGELVPYGQVWRTGANEATTLKLSDPVKINGKTIPAGTYALFAIPGPDHWTLIVNRRWKQMGAFEYEPKEDVLRFDVKPKTIKDHNEWLTYEIYPASLSSAYVDLYWEKLRISFLITVDVDALVSERMKKAMAKAGNTDWKLYCDAAEYFLEQNKELAKALEWINKSIQIRENATNLYIKARILRSLGQAPQAYQVAERALKVGQKQGAPRSVTGPIQTLLDKWKQLNGNKVPSHS